STVSFSEADSDRLLEKDQGRWFEGLEIHGAWGKGPGCKAAHSLGRNEIQLCHVFPTRRHCTRASSCCRRWFAAQSQELPWSGTSSKLGDRLRNLATTGDVRERQPGFGVSNQVVAPVSGARPRNPGKRHKALA